MRPVNLIPPEDRGRGARSAPIAYILVGALALGLGAVTMVVLTNNKIADRKTEIATLGEQNAALAAQADQLSTFSEFSDVQRQRTATIEGLANSRFDWERVMRELSLVLPEHVSLTSLTASASGTDSASGTVLPGASAGPSLSLSGCARGHEGVAGLLGALRDIDGVTSVNLSSSDKGGDGIAGVDTASTTGGEAGCSAGKNVSQFEISVSLEGAAPAADATATSPTAPAPAGSTPTATESAPVSSETATVPGS